jgi:hypothetical protein
MALLAARGLVRLLALILTTALAAAGLAAAVFSIQGGSATLSLSSLAGMLSLGDLRTDVGDFLAQLHAGGPIAKVAALAGVGAVLLGLLLLFGVLARRRERLVVLRSDDGGRIAARPRAVGQAAVALGEQSRDVLQATAKTTPRRHGTGGRLCLTLYEVQPADGDGATAAGSDRVRSLADPFALRVRVRSRAPRRGVRAG